MEKVNWLDLNSEFHNRSKRTSTEYDKLKEKIKNSLRNEKNLNDLNEQLSIFNTNSERYFADSYEILTLAIQQIGLEIFKKDWINLNGSDYRKEAVIWITSALQFKPLGFNLAFRFLIETNPITYRQEFTLTVHGYKSEDNGLNYSERYKQTKEIHNIKSLKDWEKLGFANEQYHEKAYAQRIKLIENELYYIIKDFIVNSVLYSEDDFQTINKIHERFN